MKCRGWIPPDLGSCQPLNISGMTAEQLASAINTRRLHIRKDRQPVSTKQIWWEVKTFSSTLTYAEEGNKSAKIVCKMCYLW